MAKDDSMMVSSDYLDDLGLSMAMGVPNSWLIYKGRDPLKVDDLGVPPFQEMPHMFSVYFYDNNSDYYYIYH